MFHISSALFICEKGKECNKDVIREKHETTGEDFIISFCFYLLPRDGKSSRSQ